MSVLGVVREPENLRKTCNKSGSGGPVCGRATALLRGQSVVGPLGCRRRRPIPSQLQGFRLSRPVAQRCDSKLDRSC